MKEQVKKFSTSTAILLVMTGGLYAADVSEPQFEARFEGTKPAVSAFNGKLDLGYFYHDFSGVAGEAHGGFGIASVSAPLGHSFGVQVDAGYLGLNHSGIAGDITSGGGALHLFWRNPDLGLVGLYGHYASIDVGPANVAAWRYGAEAEGYFGPFSVEAFVGGDTLTNGGVEETFFYGELKGAYYFQENFRVEAGLVHQFDETMGRVGAEAMLPFAGNRTALYAMGTFGEDSTTVRAGLRFYFGDSGKSLQARHREDDPGTRLMDYFALGGVGAIFGGGGGGEEGGGGGEEGGGGYD